MEMSGGIKKYIIAKPGRQMNNLNKINLQIIFTIKYDNVNWIKFCLCVPTFKIVLNKLPSSIF